MNRHLAAVRARRLAAEVERLANEVARVQGSAPLPSTITDIAMRLDVVAEHLNSPDWDA